MTTTRSATQAAQLVSTYSQRVSNGEDFEISSTNDATFRAISTILDASFRRAYDEAIEPMSESKLLQEAVSYMKSHRTCGGFRTNKASLSSLTSFEQMFSVSRFLSQNPGLRKQYRTYAFRFSDDQVVPIQIKKPKNGEASLWTTIIGANNGSLKALAYEDMAKEDPSNIAEHEIFINPLTCLEMHRNPDRIGALALKSEAFDSEFIDHEWRYQNYTVNQKPFRSASAELKKQKSNITQNMVAQSAGYNLAALIAEDSQDDTRTNILREFNFEDFADDGYRDDAHPSVTAHDIVATFPQALKGNTGPLDDLTRALFVARLDRSNISAVNEMVIKLFFPEED